MTDPAHASIPEIALNWARQGGAALATVIETWGSAPRPVGAQLAISGTGEIMGSVSGGCVEGAVVAEALELIGTDESRILEFGVADEDAFSVGLACGGRIRVLVEPVGTALPETLLTQLVAGRAARIPLIYAVNTISWERRLITPKDPLLKAAEQARIADKSGFEGDWFLGVHNPPLRLVVVGAVHIAQPLVAMARQAGYDPVLVDPRESFGAAHRFPGEQISHDWPDAALRSIGLDARTAVVTLSHDPKIDDPALIEALGSNAFYIGALGSTRTHAKRCARLKDLPTGRIHAPVGADIGAKSPAEIAISILAEITERLRRPETRR